MRVGQVWMVDFLDHFDGSTATAWTESAKLNITPPLCRAVGFVVKLSPEAVALAVSYGQGESTSPFVILRSAIVTEHQVKLPMLRRKPINKS